MDCSHYLLANRLETSAVRHSPSASDAGPTNPFKLLTLILRNHQLDISLHRGFEFFHMELPIFIQIESFDKAARRIVLEAVPVFAKAACEFFTTQYAIIISI
jgi:hypothetical protein